MIEVCGNHGAYALTDGDGLRRRRKTARRVLQPQRNRPVHAGAAGKIQQGVAVYVLHHGAGLQHLERKRAAGDVGSGQSRGADGFGMGHVSLPW